MTARATYLDEIVAAHRASAARDERDLHALTDAARARRPARGFARALAARRPVGHRRDQAALAVEGRPRTPTSTRRCSPRPTRRAAPRASRCSPTRSSSAGRPTTSPGARAASSSRCCARTSPSTSADVCDARLMGADAMLLIVAALVRRRARAASTTSPPSSASTRSSRCTTSPSSSARSAVGATLVGVNQRDLATFEVDHDRAVRMAARDPGERREGRRVGRARRRRRRAPRRGRLRRGARRRAPGHRRRTRRAVDRATRREEDRDALSPAGRQDADRRGSTCCPGCPSRLQPPLHPGTKEPVGPDDLAPLFPMALIAQEMSAEPWIDIPGEVLDILRLWRPTPLVRADAPRAGARHAGAHLLQGRVGVARPARTSPTPRCRRPSTTRPRASTRLTTETGAGQWGTALAFACAQFDLECKVYMVRASYDQKPYRRDHHGDVGRASACRRRSTTRRRPARSVSRSPTPCATPPAGTTPTTRSARCSTTCCCTRRSSGSRPRSSSRWPARRGPTS